MPLKKDIVATPYDFADYLETEDDARAAIAVAFEDGDPAVITRMMGAVARSKGMTSVSAATNLGRESLYKALSATGNPELKTLIKVLEAFGLKLAVEPIHRPFAEGASADAAGRPRRSAMAPPLAGQGARKPASAR